LIVTGLDALDVPARRGADAVELLGRDDRLGGRLCDAHRASPLVIGQPASLDLFRAA
jgi:hypothetical protein